MTTAPNRRILLIDDNRDIHRDFRKILSGGEAGSPAEGALRDAEEALFGDDEPDSETIDEFELDSAYQGQQALEMLSQSLADGRPYAVAFVDMRMPPGWDGVETIQHLWEADPDLQAVVCTAFADYTWTDMVAKLGRTDRFLILKKPFDAIEVCQLATALTEKWDVTRRERQRMQDVVRAESEARAFAASLETVNRALEQAAASAEAAALSRSEFLARMTGGILGPMINLVDGAERIRRLEAPGDDWMAMIEELCRGGQELSDSLQDVLDLSELENGSLQLKPVVCSPREIAEQVVATLEPLSREKRLEVRVECETGAPETIESDATYVRRVLCHLVANAIKYTEQGRVRVVVAGIPGVARGVRFSVIDTGPGLTPEQRAHLFDAFCHADAPNPDPSNGAGLGLHLSRRLATALGADLGVVEGGPGTRFDLSLTSA